MAFLLQALRAVRAMSDDGDLLAPLLLCATPQGRADPQTHTDAIRATDGIVARRQGSARTVDGSAFARRTLEIGR